MHRNGKVIRKGRIEDLRTCDSNMYSTRNGLQLQQVHGAQLRAAARVEVVLGIRIGTRAERGGWVGRWSKRCPH